MLIQNDAILTLQDLFDQGFKVDHVITDPPYNINFAEWDNVQNFERWVQTISELLWRITKPNASVFWFTGWSSLATVIKNWDTRFILKDCITYDRIKGRGTKKSLVSTREDILWYVKSDQWTFQKDLAYSTIVKKTKGMGRKNGRTTRALSNVWTDIAPIVPWSKERNGYPTQKPLALMDRIITVFTNPDDLILDPFCGSGTTLVSARNNGRQYIGIDNNPVAIEISKSRLGL